MVRYADLEQCFTLDVETYTVPVSLSGNIGRNLGSSFLAERYKLRDLYQNLCHRKRLEMGVPRHLVSTHGGSVLLLPLYCTQGYDRMNLQALIQGVKYMQRYWRELKLNSVAIPIDTRGINSAYKARLLHRLQFELAKVPGDVYLCH